MFKINSYSLFFLGFLFVNSSNACDFSASDTNNQSISIGEPSQFPIIYNPLESSNTVTPFFPLSSSVTPQACNWPFNSSTNTFMPPFTIGWDPNNSTNTFNTNSVFMPITHDNMNFNNRLAILSNSTDFATHTNNNVIPPFIPHTQQVSHTNQNDNDKSLRQENKGKSHTKTYTCPTCYKSVKGHTSFKYHLRTHNPNRERVYQCNLCEKSFAEERILKNHMNRHNKEKSFKCDFCSKSFTTKQEKTRHHRTHTGERPFKCDLCSKRFKTKYDKDRHGNSCKKKPYQCSQCTSSYTTKYRLKYHIKKVHSKLKSYVCYYCDAAFCDKGDYEKHIRYEEGTNEDRKCHICKKGYSNKYNLERHNKKAHPDT